MKLFGKKINTQKSKLFWAYLVVGFLIIALSVMLMPFWEDNNVEVFFAPWGYKIIDLIICAVLLIYLFGFLFKKVVAGGNGVIKVLTIIEFSLLLLVALGCVLSQFNVIRISGACKIAGLVCWLRGVIEVFRAYYYQKGQSVKYPVWLLCIAIALVSLGMYLMLSNIIKDVVILWIFVILLLALGSIIFALGFIKKPVGKGSKK